MKIQYKKQRDDLLKMKEQFSDKEAEVRYLRRERDEERDKKIEGLIEVKKLKEDLEKALANAGNGNSQTNQQQP